MATTSTGIPIERCAECGVEHPVSRRHCVACGSASAFLNDAGWCLLCRGPREVG